MNMPSVWVIGAVPLGAHLIADKHHFGAPVNEVVEGAQVLDVGLSPVVGFIRCSPFNNPLRSPV
jgi:hypothetical protein